MVVQHILAVRKGTRILNKDEMNSPSDSENEIKKEENDVIKNEDKSDQKVTDKSEEKLDDEPATIKTEQEFVGEEIFKEKEVSEKKEVSGEKEVSDETMESVKEEESEKKVESEEKEKTEDTGQNLDDSSKKTIEVDEYYVKYRNFSYLHCEWKTQEELMKGDKRIAAKLKRFKQKMANNTNIFENVNYKYLFIIGNMFKIPKILYSF